MRKYDKHTLYNGQARRRLHSSGGGGTPGRWRWPEAADAGRKQQRAGRKQQTAGRKQQKAGRKQQTPAVPPEEPGALSRRQTLKKRRW